MRISNTQVDQPWLIIQSEITSLLSLVSADELRSLKDLFREASDQRWFFSGQGRSGLIAQMAAMRFMHLGFRCHVAGEATAPAIRSEDKLLLICGSGRTPISKGFAEIAKSEGAQLALVTHKPDSELAEKADLLLTIPMNETVQFGGTLFEQVTLILLDWVALELARETADIHKAMWWRHTNLQ